MLQFTEDLDFSECPNAGEKRLEHARDLLERSSTASARVHNRPEICYTVIIVLINIMWGIKMNNWIDEFEKGI